MDGYKGYMLVEPSELPNISVSYATQEYAFKPNGVYITNEYMPFAYLASDYWFDLSDEKPLFVMEFGFYDYLRNKCWYVIMGVGTEKNTQQTMIYAEFNSHERGAGSAYAPSFITVELCGILNGTYTLPYDSHYDDTDNTDYTDVTVGYAFLTSTDLIGDICAKFPSDGDNGYSNTDYKINIQESGIYCKFKATYE